MNLIEVDLTSATNMSFLSQEDLGLSPNFYTHCPYIFGQINLQASVSSSVTRG